MARNVYPPTVAHRGLRGLLATVFSAEVEAARLETISLAQQLEAVKADLADAVLERDIALHAVSRLERANQSLRHTIYNDGADQ